MLAMRASMTRAVDARAGDVVNFLGEAWAVADPFWARSGQLPSSIVGEAWAVCRSSIAYRVLA
jgi:hypothetical protein